MADLLLALLIGCVAGMRAMMAPAAVSWAAGLGWLPVGGTWAAFLQSIWPRWIFTAFAVGELVTDKLPSTPSRKVPAQFGARLVSGGFCGAVLCAGHATLLGALAGVIGAAAGTLGAAAARARLARAFGSDRPAALLEDLVAVVAAVVIVRLAA